MIFFLESGKILLTEIVSDISRPESAFTLLDNTIKHHFSGGNNPCNVPLSISAPTLYVYPYTMRKKRRPGRIYPNQSQLLNRKGCYRQVGRSICIWCKNTVDFAWNMLFAPWYSTYDRKHSGDQHCWTPSGTCPHLLFWSTQNFIFLLLI